MSGPSLLRSRTLPLVCLAFFLLAGEASAYVIFLKDGTRIESREKPVPQGKNFVFLSVSGNRQSIPIAEVDQKKSEEYNKMGLGDSYLLSEEKTKVMKQGGEKKPNLSEYIKANKKSEIKDRTSVTVSPEAAARPASVPAKAAPAAAAKARPAPPESNVPIDSVVSDAFTRALEGAGVRGARVSPAGSYLRVQAVTENEQQVFAAIGAAARGLKESRASGRQLDKVELVLASTTGESAGRFNITPDDAEALLNGKITAAKYFVANVVF